MDGMKWIIIGILTLTLVILPLVGCSPAPVSIATTPAEVVELVEVGMTRSAVFELIDESCFEFIAIQLSEFSNIGGKIKMIPRQTADDPNPATHIVHLYLSGEYHPAYVVYSTAWEVVDKGRMPPENATWLIKPKQ